jgi:hypothetical protein
MSDETKSMRVGVSLDHLDVEILAQVMASMPPNLRGITAADALRFALHAHGKTIQKPSRRAVR